MREQIGQSRKPEKKREQSQRTRDNVVRRCLMLMEFMVMDKV